MQVDNFSDDDLAKRYLELGDKMAWYETCKNCRLPTLLHSGPCTIQVEAVNWEKVVDEQDKFVSRMKNVINDIEEQEKEKEKHMKMEEYRSGFVKCPGCEYDYRSLEELLEHCEKEHGLK